MLNVSSNSQSWLLRALSKANDGYSDVCTSCGGTARGLERGDLLQHNNPLSYQRSVATIWEHNHLEVLGSNPLTDKNFFGTKIQLLT